MPKISVIVPVFNTSQYLSECLESILNQSFGDFEIICVDDGSTDNSFEILNDYHKKDDRVKVFAQSNHGLSSARNTALKHISGDYVLFVDSDDLICEGCLDKLYSKALSDSLDMVIFKIINFDDATCELSTQPYFELKVLKKLVGENAFHYGDIKEKFFRIPVTAPGKLYKKQLIEDMEFKRGLIFEDTAFFAEVLLKVQRAAVIDEYFYLRRFRSDSIIKSNFSKFSDVVEIYNIIEDIIKQYGKYEDLKAQLFHRKSRDTFLRFSQVPDELKKDFFKIIKNDFKTKKPYLESDGTLEEASKRSLEIFTKAIVCDSWREFELSVEIFDLKRDISKLKKENKKYKKQLKNLKSKKRFLKPF